MTTKAELQIELEAANKKVESLKKRLKVASGFKADAIRYSQELQKLQPELESLRKLPRSPAELIIQVLALHGTSFLPSTTVRVNEAIAKRTSMVDAMREVIQLYDQLMRSYQASLLNKKS
jgi:hypothetical protein